MNKNGLIAEVARRTGSSKAEVGRILDAAIRVIRESVSRRDRVSLVGFGTFERRRRNQRIARNPRQPQTPIVVPSRPTNGAVAPTVARTPNPRRRFASCSSELSSMVR